MTKNARINSDVRLTDLLAELPDISWDVICFSETRAADANSVLAGGHRLICSRGEFKYSGVAILIHARWVGEIITSRNVSDRIVYVDIRLFGRKYRIIATYVPHAGYHQDQFNACFDELRETILQANALGCKPMVGGDFNTHVSFGWRSERLVALTHETGLVIGNHPDDMAFHDSWTFRSCLGAHRVLDYVLTPSSLNVKYAKAVDHLHLGSDHRLVQLCIELPHAGQNFYYESRRRSVEWQQYGPHVQTTLQSVQASHIGSLENTLKQVADNHPSSGQSAPKSRAWDTAELRELRSARCRAEGEERKSLSKSIWRKTRQQLRVWRTEQATARLEAFSRLDRPGQIHTFPTVRRSLKHRISTIAPNTCRRFILPTGAVQT